MGAATPSITDTAAYKNGEQFGESVGTSISSFFSSIGSSISGAFAGSQPTAAATTTFEHPEIEQLYTKYKTTYAHAEQLSKALEKNADFAKSAEGIVFNKYWADTKKERDSGDVGFIALDKKFGSLTPEQRKQVVDILKKGLDASNAIFTQYATQHQITLTDDSPSVISGALNTAGSAISDAGKGISSIFSNFTAGSAAGIGLGGLLAWLFASAFGGGGWIGAIVGLGVALLSIPLMSKFGRDTIDPWLSGSGSKQATTRPDGTPQLVIEPTPPGQSAQRFASQDLYDAGAFPNRYQFANVSSVQNGGYYSGSDASFNYRGNDGNSRVGWTYRG
ncbi:MAG: hypothetical protein B7X02_00475 [Rhodospirillales bacterium 12-54-5]|nr:MAG: hypothetical protein B7X02_00475 [Rhodospirillales bacterium 12-54-5]